MILIKNDLATLAIMAHQSQQALGAARAPIQQTSKPATVPMACSSQILRGQQELRINHGDAIYVLRVTRQGKLILTK